MTISASTTDKKIRVLSARAEVLPLVGAAVAAADAHRDALGFFPAKMFEESARRECLLIAVDASGTTLQYAGHLLFDCRFPKAHVLQMLASPALRRKGIARTLLERLKELLTQQGFISIQARVAEDLADANQFWTKQRFYVQAEKNGGATRNRRIIVRSHELATPQLFPTSGLSSANPLGLDFQSADERPLYLLDLNVLFDLGPRRARNQEAINLFQAERSGLCSLAISSELIEELKRTAVKGRTDPMQDFVRVLPTFSLSDCAASNGLEDELAALVFSDSHAAGALTPNETSDIRHLATVIQHQLAGLVTSDGPLLDASPALAQRYGIQVISLLAFRSAQQSHSEDESFDTPTRQTLAVSPIDTADTPAVRALLGQKAISSSAMTNEWALDASKAKGALRFGAWIDSRLAGYMTWPTWTQSGATTVRLATDETFSQSRQVASVMLKKIVEHGTQRVSQISIELPLGQSSAREAAWSLGFGGASQGSRLFKIAFKRTISPKSWDDARNELLSAARLKLPDQCPQFRAMDQNVPLVTPDGNRSHVAIENLETLLSPAIFCLPGRPAVITPIQRDFAEPLLGHSPQSSFLPHSKASAHAEKHYLSDPKALKHLKRGTIIFFYESGKKGGAEAIVAIARVRRSYLKPLEAIESPDLDPSVLDANTLHRIGSSKIKAVTTFDNVMALPAPVPMKTLKALGCGRPTDLITTRPITDAQMAAILDAGFPQ